MKKFPLLLLAPLLFGAGCSLFDTGPSTYPGVPPTPVPVVNPVPTMPTPTSTTPTPTTTSVLEDSTKSIRVTDMTANQLLPRGFEVKGEGVAFESQLSWRVENAKNIVIGRGSFHVNQPDAGIPGPFSFIVEYDATKAGDTGYLVVYEASPKDGSDTHVVRIPVKFHLSM